MEILLALQSFRNGTGAAFASFFEKMTWFGELNTVLAVMALVYWCVSREYGTYLLTGWCGNRLVNGFLKVTACAYRPWIRDARIVPYGNTMTTATGYSFPSGHSMNAASAYGGAVVRKDLPKSLRWGMGILVALVAFSRLYVGVHTPQDVLVGAAAGMLVMWLTIGLLRWAEAAPGRDLAVALIGLGLAAALALYAGLKGYPEDFDAAGKLIVDGKKMANDTFKGVGWCAAFLVGWVLQRRYAPFTTDLPMARRFARGLTGLIGLYVVTLVLVPLVKDLVGGPAGTMTSCFLQMFYVAFLFPWCVSLRARRKE